MKLTIQEIIDSFDAEMFGDYKDLLDGLEPEDEIIRKQIPASMLRFVEGETAIVGVISDLRKDRDDEVILPEGMDDSNYSGVVLWQHDYWRQDVPHARSMWRQLDPKGAPFQVLAKTQYLGDFSDLGGSVFEYRKAKNPLGQSIGFRSKESVRKGDTGYDEIFKDWKTRVKAMLKEKKIKATQDEFTEPWRIFTKWELWEYSDVFIGSNPDALQIAVSKNIITNDEARLLVDFTPKEADKDSEQIAELVQRVADLEEELTQLKQLQTPIAIPLAALENMWTNNTARADKLEEFWNGNEM